jgi:hypothetical protein
VNFDFEGKGSQDQRGLDNLIGQVTAQLRAANPHWQITMSTYASSAGDGGGFFDIAGLAQYVDAFFVMAYDMNDFSHPSATSPIAGPGNNDNVDLAEYASLVPRSKIILGVPYYGYDWPTAGPNAGDPATGSPSPVPYAQVRADNGPLYWDRNSDTPWTAYQDGNQQWHQVFYDDPTSLALKARLANAYRIAGLGIWALGMDGNDPAMLAALLGNAKPAKYLVGPSSSSTTGAPGAAGTTPGASTTYSYSGVFAGTRETLTPVQGTLPGNGAARAAGPLQDFSTNDPAAACLSGGKPLEVYELVAAPGTYVVQATTPAYCASGTWEFTGPPGENSSSSTTTTTSPPSSTPSTTAPPLLGGFGSTTTTTKPAASTSTTRGFPLGL